MSLVSIPDYNYNSTVHLTALPSEFPARSLIATSAIIYVVFPFS